MQNTRKMPQFWPMNCFSCWEFWDTFRNCLSTKCAAWEKCCSLGRKIVFRVGNFQTLFESFCQRNAKHKTNVTVWSGKLFSTLVISRHFSKVFISEIRNARKMSQFGSKNWFSRWKFPATFRKLLSVKCRTREKCHTLDQKMDFRVGNFRHFSKAPVGSSVNRPIGAPRRPPGSYPPRPPRRQNRGKYAGWGRRLPENRTGWVVFFPTL